MHMPEGLKKPRRIALLIPPVIALLLMAWLFVAMVTTIWA